MDRSSILRASTTHQLGFLSIIPDRKPFFVYSSKRFMYYCLAISGNEKPVLVTKW